jgi:hypothetical protein
LTTSSAHGLASLPLSHAIHEFHFSKHLVALMPLLKRHVQEDMFSMWTGTAAEFPEVQLFFMNNLGSLKRKFSNLRNKVDHLNMTVCLKGPRLHHATICEKALNLCHSWSLPSNSAHPLGASSDLIHGLIKQIFHLVSNTADCQKN